MWSAIAFLLGLFMVLKFFYDRMNHYADLLHAKMEHEEQMRHLAILEQQALADKWVQFREAIRIYENKE